MSANWFALVAVGLFCLFLGVGLSMVGQSSVPKVYTVADVRDAFALIGLLMMFSYAAGTVDADRLS